MHYIENETGQERTMAKEEHLEHLRQGAQLWNTWRATKPPDFRPDLSSADLSGARLSGARLSGARLNSANLSKANLDNANLSRADLSKADLFEANFNSTNLSDARLSGADLSGARLNSANLSSSNLSSANFLRTDLSGADLSGADLSDAHLNRANLFEANLSSANLSGAHLNSTDLSGVDLSDTDLNSADLSGADLSSADLSRADLAGANLSSAIVHRTLFNDLDLRGVQGLDSLQHEGPSTISAETLERSQGNLPDSFLRGAGLSDRFITCARSLVADPSEYYTCFLSYSSKDQDFAERLHADLQSKGVRCWFAPKDLDIGDMIRPRIEEIIRRYDKLIVVLSAHSIASTWVAYEVEQALSKEPAGAHNVLYPIRLDAVVTTVTATWAENIKRTRHIGDFEHWKDHDEYQKSFQRLLRALQQSKQAK